MVSPFLCSDDSELDTEMPERHVSPTPHDAMLTRWRSRVASRSSSPTTSTLEIHTAPIPPAPSAVVALSTDIISPDIPIGQLYCTHPGGPCRALTMRKSVRPLPSHHLALRHTSHHLDRFTSGSSSDHSSLDHSSSGHSISGHSLSGHTPPDTTIADSSAPPSLFIHHLLGLYVGDSSSKSSAGPSCKRCRYSILLEDSVEEDIDIDVLADIEADALVVEVVADMDVEAGVDASIGMEVDVGVDVEDEVEDEVESSDRGTMEVRVDVVAGIDIPDSMLMPNVRVEDIETGQRELKARSLIAGRERASLLEHVASLERSNALAAYKANRAAELAVESQSQNGDDDDNGNGGGNGNGNREGNGNGNPNRNGKGVMPVALECTYHDFVKCQPLNFKGTKGVVGLTRWFEKMETVFHISNCPKRYQVKYATCTLLNNALTWWNAHKRIIGVDVAFSS
ncbi:hypothetical protein Tco_0510925 [Tanacetum coccineum]